MKQNANASFAIKAWDEKPYREGENLPRLTRASVTNGVFEGGLAKEAYSVVFRHFRIGHRRAAGAAGRRDDLCGARDGASDRSRV